MGQYIHEELEKDVQSISGSYIIEAEERLQHGGKNVLCIIGSAVMDTTCCGVGGCRFINIPGYVVSWKERNNDSGLPVSEVNPITDENEQKKIKKILDLKYPHSQINFGNS
jgi:hypothetical protein